MVSTIWSKLIDCKDDIIDIFNEQATEIQEDGLDYFNRPDSGWINRVWANDNVRRAHVDVVDARDTKGLWMMHVCIFPTLDNPDPDHPMIQGYYESVEHFVPEKPRELPEWARNIFTGKMLAAGNVKTDEEATEIIKIALSNLHAYFEEVGETKGEGAPDLVAACQNYYCENQQKNPHTANVMKSLGLPEEDVDRFCTDMLFPKLT